MYQVEHNTGMRIAADIREAHAAVDIALLRITELSRTMLQAGSDIQLAPAEGQKALEAMVGSFSTQVDVRGQLIAAHRQLSVIKLRTDQAETDFGCLGEGPLLGRAHLKVAVAA